MTTLAEARSALAAEWASRSPGSPAEIADFYRTARGIRADLEAWHETADRKQRTAMIVETAKQIQAQYVLDIGAGIGRDLEALAGTCAALEAVEPNIHLRKLLAECLESSGRSWVIVADVAAASVEKADLVLLIDVLEHVPDPDQFLTSVARRMRFGGAAPGAVLIETHGAHDVDMPLHLAPNRRWHPGHTLEREGFELLASLPGPMRVWQRSRRAGPTQATALILCAYRALSVPTFASVQGLIAKQMAMPKSHPWRVITKTDDGLISRARSIAASRWLLETNDDVFLMVDDDITFFPEVAEHVVELARDLDIVCAAYPVRSGHHLAIRPLTDDPTFAVTFGPGEKPMEIRYAATGFMAIHRRVLEVLARDLVFCHENTAWAFWPFFMPMVAEMGNATAYLSEDWAMCERARAAGFHVWLDPSARIGHLALIELNTANMDEVAKAVGAGFAQTDTLPG